MRIEDGKLQNIDFHNERFNRSRRELFGIEQESDLHNIIEIPLFFPSGRHKCRLIYSTEVISISFSPYTIKRLNTLQVVSDNTIEYAYKYENRQYIENLKISYKTDDILIIKNGFITDTSYANIVFWDGGKWITPSSPLLQGTMRSRLLSENRIHQEVLRKSDIKLFKSARIINAMIGLDESPSLKINNIYF
jgi:4-amino-4-deoxychorismate lyase